MGAHGGLIVSVSGIRGVVGEGLTARSALAFAQALGAYAGAGAVVVGRDGRPSGSMLRHAVLAGLTAAGRDVTDAGVVPTPTLGLAVREFKAAGGVQITASHNPAPWNGLKLFGPDGRVLSAGEGRRVQGLFESGEVPAAGWDRVGSVYENAGALAVRAHVERVVGLVDAGRVRAAGLKVFLDANGGAGGPLGRELLGALGVGVVCEGCEADGYFRHEPEPTAENLRQVALRVRREGVDLGLALDPDADRLALIDESGRYVGEELTLALAVRYRLGQQRGPVVVNLSTSRVVEDVAGSLGCPCHRAAVGEANVADRMQGVGAVIGGEGNGGVIDPRVGLVRDPFIGMGLILSLMARAGKRLSELVAELPAYHIVKGKYEVARERLAGLLEGLARRWPEARADRADGLRLDWEDRWVHVRPSNTEAVVRVIAEAREEGRARALCAEVGAMLAG
jgi:phosphomannomutase